MNDSAPADFRSHYRRGLLTSVRANSAPYGFSVMITAAFGALNAAAGSPPVLEVFLFALGAVGGFVTVEILVAPQLWKGERGEPSHVVALGSVISLFSVAAGVGAAALTGLLVPPPAVWLVGPLLATVAYLLLVGLELALAQEIEQRASP